MRMYWGTAVLLVAAGIGGLTVLLPVTSLWLPGSPLATRLGLTTASGSDLGIPWLLARSPDRIQHDAVVALFGLLVGTAVATLATATLTILTLSAARGSAREPEVAVRRAVGASRGGLLAAALLEAAAVGAAALALGSVLGVVGTRVAIAEWPGIMELGTLGPDVVAALAIAAAIVMGAILPLAFPRQKRVAEAEAKPQGLLVPAFQLGISLTVLTASALIVRHAAHLIEAGRAGAGGGGGQVFEIAAPDGPPAERASQYAALLERLNRQFESGAVSLTSRGAIAGLGTVAVAVTECGRCYEGSIYTPWRFKDATHQLVTADSFQALGVHLIAGRGITSADRWGSQRVAVISRLLAARHFQDGNAIGRALKVGVEFSDWYTVVGVVDDRQPIGFGAATLPEYTVYLSLLQLPARSVELLIRSGASTAVTPVVNGALRETLGPLVPRVEPVAESALLAAEIAPLEWFGRWFRVEGWATLGLAVLGTFALMRLWVLSLRPELGVRRAMGARRSQILWFLLSRAAAVGMAGVVIGLWFGPALWQGLSQLVVGLPSWDPGIVAGYGSVLVATAIAGAVLPGWQAINAPPAELIGSG